MWEDGHNLVLVSESGDQRAHRVIASKDMQQLQFILYSPRAACYVDLLNSDISRSYPSVSTSAISALCQPGSFLKLKIPIVLIVLIVHIFCFVDSGERT